jgi:hypothetical protein
MTPGRKPTPGQKRRRAAKLARRRPLHPHHVDAPVEHVRKQDNSYQTLKKKLFGRLFGQKNTSISEENA